jgi:hypothetical protein
MLQTRFAQIPTNRSHELWSFEVSQNEQIVFDSVSLGIRLKSRAAAEWLSALIEHLLANQGLPNQADADWSGDLNDDCHFDDGTFHAHAEHCTGPKRGGVWYCMVEISGGQERYFHTADLPGIEPKSGTAARKLCKMVISAAQHQFLLPYSP